MLEIRGLFQFSPVLFLLFVCLLGCTYINNREPILPSVIMEETQNRTMYDNRNATLVVRLYSKNINSRTIFIEHLKLMKF
ncbi:hypothetical protein Trydic_g18680 [Trypoxylus dichotomus]